MQRRRALLLHDRLSAESRPDEVDVLAQVEQVSAALHSNGWETSVQPADLELAAIRAAIEAEQPACIVNLVESLAGDGRLIPIVPALLSHMGVPFTGSSSDAIHLSSHKEVAKAWMRSHGVPAPRSLRAGDVGEADHTRWIVKSLWEHASLGLDDASVVTGSTAALARIEHCRCVYGGIWFAEEYVEGREFNISIIEHDGQPLVLPLAEMTFVDYPAERPKIVGYAAKWDEESPDFHATQRVFATLGEQEREALTTTAQQCWRLFGLNGYARVDIRLHADGTPYVLEVNANPCLTRDAGFAAAAKQGGIDYETMIRRIIEAALRPALRTFRRTG
jgi:D-alanine-D-alanine ligase